MEETRFLYNPLLERERYAFDEVVCPYLDYAIGSGWVISCKLGCLPAGLSSECVCEEGGLMGLLSALTYMYVHCTYYFPCETRESYVVRATTPIDGEGA